MAMQGGVAIVGGGTMGADVAVVFLRGGHSVVLVEPDAARRQALRPQIQAGLDAIGRGRAGARLHLQDGLDAVAWAGIGLVVECIPEQLPLKQALFAELAQRCPAQTWLASNSSSFPISRIGQGLPGAERMLGLHFFMPAHLVPLVEVVMGPASGAAQAQGLMALLRACGSVPVLVRKDKPGFLANRLQHALAREAFALIDEGVASPQDVDAAVRFGFGFRFLAAGPVLQRDHAGLEVHCAAAATVYPTLCNASEPAQALRQRVAQGQLGMKTGQGFFSWDAAAVQTERERYARLLRAGLDLLQAELPPLPALED